jgi:lipoprotein-anchoring transpeptidase ErfK/SrfK
LNRLLPALLAACLAAAATAAPPPRSWAEAVNGAGRLAAPARAAGPALLRAQILLDRAHFSSGEIDGAYGANLRQAIAGYQKKNGLAVNGRLDADTWAALNADSADAVTSYTIAEADVAGPFQPVPEDMAGKARLPALGYASALEALAEKFHASPALLARLNPGKDFSRAGEQLSVPNVLDTEPLPKAGKIVVAKADHTLSLFDSEGVLVAQFPASIGSAHDPLPIGSWKVKGVVLHPTFHYNPELFWDAQPGEKKAAIAAGPNNPVGVVWIDLSKPHYGIHGTPEPGAIGKTQSHGCIRLTNWDVAALAQSAVAGIDVILQE